PYVVFSGSGIKAIVKLFDGCNWVQVGLNYFSTSAIYPKLQIDKNNVPYISFLEGNSGDKLTVITLKNNYWEILGGYPVSDINALYNDMSVGSDNKVYVIYKDFQNGSRATVMMYYGTTWATLGVAGFSDSSVLYTSISALKDGIPYVAFENFDANRISVMSYNKNIGSYKNSRNTTH